MVITGREEERIQIAERKKIAEKRKKKIAEKKDSRKKMIAETACFHKGRRES